MQDGGSESGVGACPVHLTTGWSPQCSSALTRLSCRLALVQQKSFLLHPEHSTNARASRCSSSINTTFFPLILCFSVHTCIFSTSYTYLSGHTHIWPPHDWQSSCRWMNILFSPLPQPEIIIVVSFWLKLIECCLRETEAKCWMLKTSTFFHVAEKLCKITPRGL